MAQNTDQPDHALQVADLDDAALAKWLKANAKRLADIAFDWSDSTMGRPWPDRCPRHDGHGPQSTWCRVAAFDGCAQYPHGRVAA